MTYPFSAGEILTAANLNLVAVPDSMSTWTSPILGGITAGNGTTTAQYLTAGSLTYCIFRFVLGTTSSVTGSISLDLPVDASFSYAASMDIGIAYDVSATTGYPVSIETTGSTSVILRVWNTASTFATNAALSSTVPFTWATSDVLAVSFWYPHV